MPPDQIAAKAAISVAVQRCNQGSNQEIMNDQQNQVSTLEIADLESQVGPYGASDSIGAAPCAVLGFAIWVYANSNR